MLTELSLSRFKAHEDTRVPLARLTVLVGPNACGKTSALEALRYLSRVPRMLPGFAFDDEGVLPWLVRQGATEPMRLSCSGTTEGRAWTYQVTAPSDGALFAARDEWTPAPGTTDDLPAATLLRLEARRLGEPSTSDQEEPTLAEDGYGLATVLSTLKVRSTDRFEALEDAARRVVPRLRALGFRRLRRVVQQPRTLTVEGQKVIVHDQTPIIADELLLDFDDVQGLPARVASEGTLVTLGILASLFASTQPGLVLLDDLERGLHPKAQCDLVASLRAALDATPALQVVATTHSPYLVDELPADEVVVLGRGGDGVVVARRLADHPKARLLDALTTGEFWAAEGEDWVASR